MRSPIRSALRSGTLSLVCALAGLPAGCTSYSAQTRVSPSYRDAASPADASGQWRGADPASTAPAAAGGELGGPAARAESPVYDVTPAERPGLGTVFGETRSSTVREVDFERQSDAPTFLASLHYNDAQGVAALRARLGSRYGSSEPVFHYFRSDLAYRPWGGVTISVVDEAGRPLAAYHEGNHVLLVGEAGQRYALHIENRTGQRFELVASVDGLDVVDGKLASPGKRGYIVSPHGRLVIEGYRRSLSEVAAFRFGSVRDSYAAQTGEQGDRNVGVIGVALFAERGAPSDLPARPELDEEAGRREAADPFPGRFAAPPPRPYY